MGFVFMIVVGAVLGWLFTFVVCPESSHDLKVNLAAGIGGAVLAGFVLAPALSLGNLAGGTYTVDALLFSMAGSLAALLLANFLRQREVL